MRVEHGRLKLRLLVRGKLRNEGLFTEMRKYKRKLHLLLCCLESNISCGSHKIHVHLNNF